MKLTKNQWEVRQWLNDYCDINIIVDVKEKNWIFTSPNAGDVYECNDCGKVRQVSEVWEDNCICWECFNSSHKIPFVLYNMDKYIYGDVYAKDFGNNILDWFKKDKSLFEIKQEYKKYRMSVLEDHCIELKHEKNHAWIIQESDININYEKDVLELSKRFPKLFFWIAKNQRASRGHWPVIGFSVAEGMTSINVGSYGDEFESEEWAKNWRSDLDNQWIYEKEHNIGVTYYHNGNHNISPRFSKDGKVWSSL